ncbi:Exocyst complex component 2 [Nymphon striatum]|nr:Exocyst complex component 2 [Nymphon striatum]
MAREPPKVTGLAPNAGPPGTKLTIRGENLGTGLKDLIDTIFSSTVNIWLKVTKRIMNFPSQEKGVMKGKYYAEFNPYVILGLTICGKDSLLSAEWKSSNKIICRSGSGTGKGDVIITTKSGGIGSCTVQFRGFMETIGPVKEAAVWVDESILVNPVFARKRATSPSQFHPVDPLELSDELNEEKFPEEELMEMFPDGLCIPFVIKIYCVIEVVDEANLHFRCGDLRVENFVPAWFLLENHNGTNFDDLKSGLNCLKRKVSQHKEGPLSFLKANVQPVMDCLDTLSNLKKNIDSYEHETEEQSIEKLEAAINKSKEGANALFEEVLKRKDHADATRNALNVMQRFKFLFNLPCNIERNINKGDYSVVINDYARVKSLFAETDIQVFRKVYEEVEEKIDGLRKILRAKLRTLPNNLEDQKKIIKCLVDLEASGDPAWECIQHQYNCVGDIIKQCRDSYLDQVLNEKNEDPQLPIRRRSRKESLFSKNMISLTYPLIYSVQNFPQNYISCLDHSLATVLFQDVTNYKVGKPGGAVARAFASLFLKLGVMGSN